MMEPTAQQRRQRAVAQELVHEALRGLDGPEIIGALHAHFSGRSDIGAAELEWIGNQLCRMAWEMER